MTINLSVPQTMQELRPRITVVGVGGAGCNAVNNMINADLQGVDFLVANTDGQALAHSLASQKIQLGGAITQGLGAGSKPEIGRAAAEESLEEVMAELADCNMVFITAGMGGGTGTGAAPVIAKAARDAGILTVAVITKPFEFEGQRRMGLADAGIEELQSYVDTLIVIPNQNLFRLANERTTFADAFHMADTVLHQGVCGVTDLMIKPGMINLDFADIRAVMSEMGKAMMGTGEASGETRATQAAEAAINNPLLDDTTMHGARSVLINVTGGLDMTLFEVDEAANRIRKEIDPEAVIIFGSAFDEKLDGVMRVSVVATGIDAASAKARPSVDQPKIETAKPPMTTSPVQANAMASAMTNPVTNAQITPTQSADSASASTSTVRESISSLAKEADDEADTPAASNSQDASVTETVSASETDSTATGPITENTGEPVETQLELTDAVDAATALNADVKADTPNNVAMSATNEAGSGEASSGELASGEAATVSSATAKADTASLTSRLMPRFDLQNEGNAKAEDAPRKTFIPAAPTAMPDEASVPKAAETPAPRPTSIIKQISELWSSKPGTTDSQKRSEPNVSAKDSSEDKTSSVLDLPQSAVVKPATDPAPTAQLEQPDDELDIPAFLRRQVN
ncbi:cell division protein FtsZ [Candidatus Puniceispirillum marinum]|uniref:Cell division protein FtsZ n=1 Tax=Puniceispirillum marinum (strain IMCC1322) TaxID=488538 RepID=D5BPR9_PUNMI|nr:cell division protein FtsZ [Candidatus Puniceispirillum marinum]ADE40571.1 cell division protein FtsZ [Candidatus Puniceispirillum marinum IMCC1322]